jgi:prepilin-type N-terminal cleavage/methylation domain-containing protein
MMNRKDRGFTLIEIIVVLVLISIIAATVFGRSITTGQINLAGEVAKIRNHIRYAQSMAMKRLDMNSDERWGIKCLGGQYWLFNYENFGDDNNAVILPGEENEKISLSDLGVTMNAYTLFFDALGIPYKASPTNPVTPANPLNIAITVVSDASLFRTLNVTPETGLITTQ